MKHLILLLALSILISCQSKQSAPEQDSSYQSGELNEADLAPETPVAQKTGMPKPDVQKSVVTSNSVLDEAIRGQNDEAIYRAASGALSQNPKDLKAQNALGLYHYRKGHWLAADYFFSRAVSQSPNTSELHNNLGLVKLALKEKREAIVYFKKSFELNNDNPVAAANLGALYTEQKEYNKALQALEVAFKRGPRDYKVLNNFGIALAANGKFDLAKDRYQEAIKINSSGREAMYNLAALYIDQMKNYQDGLDLLNKLRFLGPPESVRMRMNVLENKAKAAMSGTK